ncbi:MAG: hypothetical protein RBT36_04630 [Desulfobulbus sp.]|jgi:hypothetical protein|nr:hypothetical protein [Desulfobulbus sp.]
MQEKEFELWSRQAEARQKLATTPEEASFMEGYAQGLQRARHGEAFASETEHQANLAAARNEADGGRRLWGQGYTAGVNGMDPLTALGMIL